MVDIASSQRMAILFGLDIVRPINGDAHLAFLRQNLAGSPMTVLFRRDCLLAVNGFDETLRRCEDYDLYLRLARKYPIASYPTIVAEYRKHGQDMSNDYVGMLKEALLVLDLDEARIAYRSSSRRSCERVERIYEPLCLSNVDAASVRWRARHNIGILVRDLIQAARWSPYLTMRTLLGFLGRRVGKVLPHPIAQLFQLLRCRP